MEKSDIKNDETPVMFTHSGTTFAVENIDFIEGFYVRDTNEVAEYYFYIIFNSGREHKLWAETPVITETKKTFFGKEKLVPVEDLKLYFDDNIEEYRNLKEEYLLIKDTWENHLRRNSE